MDNRRGFLRSAVGSLLALLAPIPFFGKVKAVETVGAVSVPFSVKQLRNMPSIWYGDLYIMHIVGGYGLPLDMICGPKVETDHRTGKPLDPNYMEEQYKWLEEWKENERGKVS